MSFGSLSLQMLRTSFQDLFGDCLLLKFKSKSHAEKAVSSKLFVVIVGMPTPLARFDEAS